MIGPEQGQTINKKTEFMERMDSAKQKQSTKKGKTIKADQRRGANEKTGE